MTNAAEFATFVHDMNELLAGYARSHLTDHQPLAQHLAPTGPSDEA